MTGCNDVGRKAESLGIIDGADSPTAVWMTTRWGNTMHPMWLEIILRAGVCAIACCLLFVVPFRILLTGIKRNKKWRIVIGTIWLVASCALVAFAADQFSVRHERILDHGRMPDGREYVLFQTCTGEPYNVELFIRDAQGKWVFYYVDHEVWPWRSGGHLDFSGGTVRVFHGNEPFCTIDLIPTKDATDYPASTTAEELFDSCRAH